MGFGGEHLSPRQPSMCEQHCSYVVPSSLLLRCRGLCQLGAPSSPGAWHLMASARFTNCTVWGRKGALSPALSLAWRKQAALVPRAPPPVVQCLKPCPGPHTVAASGIYCLCCRLHRKSGRAGQRSSPISTSSKILLQNVSKAASHEFA